MKTLAAILITVFSVQAFAISNSKLIQKCWSTGEEKILAEAEAARCEINIEEMQVILVENRFWNPVKYVYYKVDNQCGDADSVLAMVQYADGQCF